MRKECLLDLKNENIGNDKLPYAKRVLDVRFFPIVLGKYTLLLTFYFFFKIYNLTITAFVQRQKRLNTKIKHLSPLWPKQRVS